MKRAFTLIELLVVIAIIAILAAILFPVFAQAKDAAKKSVGLSNVKQIGTGMHLYLQDNDDTTPSTWVDGAANKSVDIYQTMQPYVKNMDVFFSPVWNMKSPSADPTTCRNDNTVAGAYTPTGDNVDRCLGYGYNWGFGVWAGGGLVGANQPAPNGGTVLPGVSATSAEDPARLAAFGDTYNGRRYTISAVGSILTWYSGAERNSALRHGGQFNFNYLDGHAKSLKMAGFTYAPATPKGAGYVALPSDKNLWVPMYCLSPSTIVDAGQLKDRGSRNATPIPMSCEQLINVAMAGGVLGPKPVAWPN